MSRRLAAWVALAALLTAGCSGISESEASTGDSTTSSASTGEDAPTPSSTDSDTDSDSDSDSELGTDSSVSNSASHDDDGTTTTTESADDTTSTTEEDGDPGGNDGPDGNDTTSTTEAGPARLEPVEPGQSGETVKVLQERLAELGFAPGVADGAYGGQTTAAVEAFQILVDLEATGIADAETIAALADYQYDGLVLHAGDQGQQVEELQRRLAGSPLDPGPIDGQYGTTTTQAVWALEKLAGIPVDGDWGPLDERAWERLANGEIGGAARSHDRRWVEVDLSEQLMKVYDPGQSTPVLISHISSGSGVPWSNADHSGSSVTPLGDFAITRRIAGWRESSLNIGRLYNPLYFSGGIALHGALSVPLHPASHGCVRVPMHIAEYLPGELPDGTPVHVLA
jgi:peptidoglycan hydrolase-like protein with peptidoglycan-binding domain